MLFRRHKNKIFALRTRSELPESAALRQAPGRHSLFCWFGIIIFLLSLLIEPTSII
ncbi:Uncharacterized protein dnm_081670 [Desulfonema magnum]|uniref:Uncharacterized protein n=1 Tax=Desulfonema magnum TaxID=45655 RepID=A0A975BVF5_9BACT|nr:Uncharacterized protein dnm_081670 [Desulfonema magnum]